MAPTKKSLFIGAVNLLFVAGWLSSWFGELTCVYSTKVPLIAPDGPAFAMLETEAGIWSAAIGVGSHLVSEFSFAEFRPNSKRSSPSWYTPTDTNPFGDPLLNPSVANLIFGTYGFSFDRQVAVTLPFWIPVALISGFMSWLWMVRRQSAEQTDVGSKADLDVR